MAIRDSIRRNPAHRYALLCGLLATVCMPHAIAADAQHKPGRAQNQAVAQAEAALQRGDHAAAARAFAAAYKREPAKTRHLFDAATQWQFADQDESALEAFQEFVGLHGVDPALLAQAEHAIALLRSAERARQATAALARGDAPMAAQLFRDAWKFDTSQAALLLRAAKAAEAAKAGDQTLSSLNLFLVVAAADDPQRPEAQAWMDRLTAPPQSKPVVAVAPPVAKPVPKPAVVVAPPPAPTGPSGQRIAGIATLAAGGALVASGAVLVATARGKSADAATERYVAAGVCGGAGVAAAAVGVWLLWTDAPVAVAPTGQGVVLAGTW